MKKKINKILSDNFREGNFHVAEKQLLDLIKIIKQNEKVCPKCGSKKRCEWCNPFDTPIPPEGIIL